MTAPSPAVPVGLPVPARPPLAARLPLLGLYPAKYRAANGEEITAVFAETTEHVSPWSALREWAALAAHALRLRTRLSSTDPAGRIAAGAAPFVLAGGAGLNTLHLLIGLFLYDREEQLPGGHPAIRAALIVAQTVPWILALICASLGRWTPARLLVLLGILGRIGATLAFIPDDSLFGGTPLFLLVMPFGLVPGIVLLLAPPDAVDLSARGRNETVLTAVALAVPMSALAICWNRDTYCTPGVLSDLDETVAWPAAVMSLALLRHLGAHRPDRLRATGIALAALPWTAIIPHVSYALITPPYLWVRAIPYSFPGNVGVVLALLAALRHALHRIRRTEPPQPT